MTNPIRSPTLDPNPMPPRLERGHADAEAAATHGMGFRVPGFIYI